MVCRAEWIFRKDTRLSFSEENQRCRTFNRILGLAHILVDIRHKGELLRHFLENLENILLGRRLLVMLLLIILDQVGWRHFKVLERPHIIYAW